MMITAQTIVFIISIFCQLILYILYTFYIKKSIDIRVWFFIKHVYFCADRTFRLRRQVLFNLVNSIMKSLSSPHEKCADTFLPEHIIKSLKNEAFYYVLGRGLEPPWITPPVPKTGAATNYATRAYTISIMILYRNITIRFKFFKE
jgi:hypothetical protein